MIFPNCGEDRNESCQFRQDLPGGGGERCHSRDIGEAADHCKGELDELFRKAMHNLWRSTMRVNWTVTPFLG